MKKIALILSLFLSSHLALASQALIDAARDGDLAQVTRLIAEGDNVNEVDSMGYTALMEAAYQGHSEVVQALLARSEILINLANHDFGNTALMLAAMSGNIEMVQTLLSRPEILINHQNKRGNRALESATASGHTEIAQLLKNVAFERSRAYLISPAVMEITKLPPELSDVITNYLTGSEDPRNVRQTQRELSELPFHGQEIE